MKVTLNEHLERVNQNSRASQKEIDTMVKRMQQRFKACGYTKSSKNKSLIYEYIHMIFKAQGYRCTHWIRVKEGQLNGVWNRPGKSYNSWKIDHIIYEIDHVHPINAGGIDELMNYQFLSANANQFVKCSLTYEDLFKRVDLSRALKNRIKRVLTKREELFQSDKWKGFIARLDAVEAQED
tara:strand:+ start:38 stop:580 length:543 start_codon:yes stop_codon:yes gene_type:complete